MKRLLLIILLGLVASSDFYAQGPTGFVFPFDPRKCTTLDTATYRINYQTTCVLNPNTKEMVVNDMYLLIGHQVSKFGQVAPLDDPKTIIKDFERGFGVGVDGRGLGGIEVYKYLDRKKPDVEITVRMFPFSMFYTYRYKDELHTQVWSFGQQRKDILGYSCMSATTTFRGRRYTAWIATDIPISNGPWLLGGAPGLILEAYDDKHEYTFLATSIIKPKTILPIVKYQDNYKITDRRKMHELYKRLHKDFKATLQAIFSRAGFDIKTTTYYFNPIELD